MFKRAGIVVGLSIIALACVIYWIGNNISDRGTSSNTVDNKPKEQQTTIENEDKSLDPVKVSENTTSKENNSKEVNGEDDSNSPLISSMARIDADRLGNPFRNETEVMVVSSKDLVAFEKENDGQLVYLVTLLGKKKITLFLSSVGYKNLEVGDKVKVSYEVYKNSAGVEFPLLISAEKVE